MPRNSACWMLAAMLLVFSGCGASPGQKAQENVRQASTPHSMPSPTPLSGEPLAFDPDEEFPDYAFVQTDRFWVELRHRSESEVTMAIGIVPDTTGSDLEIPLREHLLQFESSPLDQQPESGSLESKVLGPVVWARATLVDDQLETSEIALFARHPSAGVLVIARSEYPAAGADDAAKLDELLEATEIIAPGL